jgi:hypothetical protein
MAVSRSSLSEHFAAYQIDSGSANIAVKLFATQIEAFPTLRIARALDQFGWAMIRAT